MAVARFQQFDSDKKNHELPCRRGSVVIASAHRTEDPVFESRQGVWFLGIYTLQCLCHTLICIVIVCTLEKNM
jgi:hypothetical protein